MRTIFVFALLALLAMSAFSVRAGGEWPESDVLTKVTSKNYAKFLSTSRPVFLAVVASWCGHCRNLAPEYVKFAKIMKNVARVGFIDGDESRDLAGRLSVQGFPTIKQWRMGPKKGVNPTDYVGPRTAAGLQNAALQEIQYKGAFAKSTAEIASTAAATERKKVFVLFTNKEKVAPLYAVLSASPVYDKKIGFLAVRTNVKPGKDVHAEFGFKVPSMHLFSVSDDDGQIEKDKTVEYTGGVDYNSIAKYLNAIAAGEEGAPGGDASSSSGDSGDADAAAPEEKKPKAPPKRALPVRVTSIDAAAITDFCSGSAIGRKQPFCVVFFSDDRKAAQPADVHAYFDKEPIIFFTAFDDEAKLEAMREAFPEHAPSSPEAMRALVFRTTKTGGPTKYAWIDGQTKGDAQNAIGQVLEGAVRMHKGTLPKIA